MGDYVPFSQRTGLAPIPPQLKLGEVSDELRRFVDYYISLEIDREIRYAFTNFHFTEKWERIAKDIHVLFLGRSINEFPSDVEENRQRIGGIIKQAKIGPLFDFVEFLVRHEKCSIELKKDLTGAFVSSRSAYRIVDSQYIAAIGNDEQGIAFEKALSAAEANDATAARSHLITAGVALRNGDWAGCVRESIHAVESAAVRLAPGTDTLGIALNVLEQHGHLHGSLKSAFKSLYGYASDEKGIRHALVLGDAPQVDEIDALFMLGACASFVSYLLARARA